MNYSSLEEKIQGEGNPVEMLRNAQVGPYIFPIPSEYSNWRDEQEAWRKTAILFDQSYHMTDLYVEGPDVTRLLSDVAVNTFKNFGRNKAKQLVCCNYDGYVVGDAVLFGLEEHKVNIVSRPVAPHWVEFQATTGGYDVQVERDERSPSNPLQRKGYRFEVQGPTALQLLEKANGGPLPDIKFFNMGEIKIGGRTVRVLRHGMAGGDGLELFGPMEEAEEIKAALLEAGQEFGLLQGGARAYSTVAHESGWIPSPMPAIYTGEKMKPYREWLSADGFEANASLGGSFVSENIEDYYLTPWDLGYGHIVNFDHDFIGREALEKLKDKPHRKKVTLSWNSDDVIRIFSALFQAGDERPKYMDLPASHYATLPYDMVLQNGNMVGISAYPVYTSNVRRWISLAMVDEGVRAPGTEVTILWGEPDGGTAKPTVERHVQTEVRATVGPCPISESARKYYRPHDLKL